MTTAITKAMALFLLEKRSEIVHFRKELLDGENSNRPDGAEVREQIWEEVVNLQATTYALPEASS